MECYELSILAAYQPFRSGDDPTADFVLETSNGVRYWLRKDAVSRGSSVFHDMLSVPQPPPAPDAPQDGPNSDYIDGKPVVRIAEKAHAIDVFLRFCYIIQQRPLRPEDLTAVYEAGDKYDVEAVRGYARQEVARFALQTDYCVRAYLIAYRFGWKDELKLAAKQSLNLPKHKLLFPELPEHHAVPASALTKLQNWRRECLEAIGGFCYPTICVKYYNNARPPLWDHENPPNTGCTCERMAWPMETMINPYGYDELDGRFLAKEWFNTYARTLYQVLQRDDTSIRRALLDPEAIDGVMRDVGECSVCLKTAPGALADFLRDVEGQIDRIVSAVSFKLQVHSISRDHMTIEVDVCPHRWF